MLNVANGNLLVQSDDISIPERGISLAFRRTYNSQSRHDWNMDDDGTVRDIFGNGWTNTFDAHISYSGGSTPVIHIWDIDGARYDYTSNGSGGWTPPTGMQGTTLAPNGQYDCYYDWTKKNGTVYEFYVWNFGGSSCGGAATGLNGRIFKIYGRNSNNSVRFVYSFQSGYTTIQHLSSITATHSDGDTLLLTLGISGSGHNLVSSVQTNSASGSKTINYYYDNNDNLTDVCRLDNGSSSSYNWQSGGSAPCSSNQLHEQYSYNANYQLALVNSPNWVMTRYGCGNYEVYTYDGGDRLIQIQDDGTSNPYLNDGIPAGQATPSAQTCNSSGSLLQGQNVGNGATADYADVQSQIWYGTSTYSSTSTIFGDVDGFTTQWSFDTNGRVTETDEGYNTSSQVSMLVSKQTWDANNNLIETIDPRKQKTDFAYDEDGNTIAVALPADANGIRPTSLYSIDYVSASPAPVNYNNITAYCDPQTVQNAGLTYDWVNRPQLHTACTASTASTFTYDHNIDQSYEPYGELISSTNSKGYTTTYEYSPASQGGSADYGLPTSVVGANISQNDGTVRTPDQTFTYDSRGNLLDYGVATGLGQWVLGYDSLNRQTAATDPTNITSYRYYNDDGSASKTETAWQHANGVGPTRTYDADGNVITESVSRGGTYNTSGSTPTLPSVQLGTTYKYYDGADRLVEVEQPHDPSDLFAAPWTTRYLYDIQHLGPNGKSELNFNGQALGNPAYGNMYKTQEWLSPPYTFEIGVTSLGPAQFMDTKAQTFDLLDRVVTKMQLVNTGQGSGESINTDTNTYDANASQGVGGEAGLLSRKCDQLSLCSSYTYDNIGRTSNVSFSDSTPARTYVYDLDGRTLSATNSNGSESYQYDTFGRLSTATEAFTPPGGVTLTAPATLTYHYYDDGKRSSIDASSSAFSQAQTALFSYAYRSDGRLKWQQVNDTNVWQNSPHAGTTTLAMSYDNVGRLTQRTEAGTGANGTPITVAYDPNYGFATTKTFPAGSFSSIQYDADGTPLGYVDTVGTNTPTTVQYFYTIRGEFRSQQGNGDMVQFANGLPVGGAVNYQNASPYKTLDTGMSVVLASTNVLPSYQGCTYTSTASQYDAAGRLTSESSTTSKQINPDGTCLTLGYSITKQYDAENHIIAATSSKPLVEPTEEWAASGYVWGPAAHPIGIGSGTSQTGNPTVTGWDTLHWDGDDLLFTTNGSGAVDDIKVGTIADITPAMGIVFEDRGFASTISFCHTATGVGGDGSQWGTSNEQTEPCGLLFGNNPHPIWSSPGIVGPAVGNGSLVGDGHGDGISDGYNTIQGVRSTDDAIGTWSTPDAFAGTVQDPATQKSYMWDGNNQMKYSDPSGYDIILRETFVAETKIPILNIPLPKTAYHAVTVVIYDDPHKAPTIYSAGPSGPLGTGYLNKNYGLDFYANARPVTVEVLDSCSGTCSGEAGMAAFNANWQDNTVPYSLGMTWDPFLGVGGNSNTWDADLQSAGGYSSAQAPDNGELWLPGWDTSGDWLATGEEGFQEAPSDATAGVSTCSCAKPAW